MARILTIPCGTAPHCTCKDELHHTELEKRPDGSQRRNQKSALMTLSSNEVFGHHQPFKRGRSSGAPASSSNGVLPLRGHRVRPGCASTALCACSTPPRRRRMCLPASSSQALAKNQVLIDEVQELHPKRSLWCLEVLLVHFLLGDSMGNLGFRNV